MSWTRSILVASALIVAPSLAMAVPEAQPTAKGCHGAAASAAARQGGVGDEIGGKGNSDGNPTNGQAHSAAGRGALVQAFLAANCDRGSLAE